MLPTGGVKLVVPVRTSSPKMIAGHLWRGFRAILDIAGCISFMVGQEVGKGKPPRPARYTCAMARGLALPPAPPFPAGIAPSMPKQEAGAMPAAAPLRLLRFAPKASGSPVSLNTSLIFIYRATGNFIRWPGCDSQREEGGSNGQSVPLPCMQHGSVLCPRQPSVVGRSL